MACSKQLTFEGNAVTPQTVYWGHVNTDTLIALNLFGPDIMPLWSDADFDSLIGALPYNETAVYREGTGYFMGSDSPFTFEQYFWFVVPDDYPDFLPTTGLQFGYENTGTPFKNVVPYSATPTAVNDGGASNWPSGGVGFTQDSGGWWYFPHTVGGVAYRFYAFGAKYNSSSPGAVCNPGATFSIGVGYSRTSNVASFTINPGIDWSPFTGGNYVITVSGCADSTFNQAQPGIAWSLNSAFTVWDYANTGVDVGFSADAGFTVNAWNRTQTSWGSTDYISDDYGIPAFSFTLFVTT